MKPSIVKPGIGAGPKPTIARPGAGRPPLPAMTVPNKNPLDSLKPSDSLQTDVDAEIDAMDAGFRERMKQEQERFDEATGSGEYFIVCFANGAQCGEFLRQLAPNVPSIKIDSDDLVVDGRDLAKFLKIEIPAGTAVGKLGKVDADFKARAK